MSIHYIFCYHTKYFCLRNLEPIQIYELCTIKLSSFVAQNDSNKQRSKRSIEKTPNRVPYIWFIRACNGSLRITTDYLAYSFNDLMHLNLGLTNPTKSHSPNVYKQYCSDQSLQCQLRSKASKTAAIISP